MQIKMYQKEDYPVSNWSGGKTTQLFIYPENSEYAKRNFLFRISSATVDCEHSEFTSLPGVDRVILPLKGNLHLFYEGHGEKVLAPYERDRFDGGWNTVSVGKATDFNLMLREGTKGEVEVHTLQTQESLCLQNDDSMMLVFVAEGNLYLDKKPFDNWQLAVIDGKGKISIQNKEEKPAKVIVCRIQLLFLKLDFHIAHAAICMDFSVLTVILLIAAAHHFRGDICSIDVEIAHAAVNIIVIVA